VASDTSILVSFDLQFKNFLGIKTTSSNRVHEQLDSVIDNIDGFQWKEFVMVRESLLLHRRTCVAPH
jgi:hypothetical protein